MIGSHLLLLGMGLGLAAPVAGGAATLPPCPIRVLLPAPSEGADLGPEAASAPGCRQALPRSPPAEGPPPQQALALWLPFGGQAALQVTGLQCAKQSMGQSLVACPFWERLGPSHFSAAHLGLTAVSRPMSAAPRHCPALRYTGGC